MEYTATIPRLASCSLLVYTLYEQRFADAAQAVPDIVLGTATFTAGCNMIMIET